MTRWRHEPGVGDRWICIFNRSLAVDERVVSQLCLSVIKWRGFHKVSASPCADDAVAVSEAILRRATDCRWLMTTVSRNQLLMLLTMLTVVLVTDEDGFDRRCRPTGRLLDDWVSPRYWWTCTRADCTGLSLLYSQSSYAGHTTWSLISLSHLRTPSHADRDTVYCPSVRSSDTIRYCDKTAKHV